MKHIIFIPFFLFTIVDSCNAQANDEYSKLKKFMFVQKTISQDPVHIKPVWISRAFKEQGATRDTKTTPGTFSPWSFNKNLFAPGYYSPNSNGKILKYPEPGTFYQIATIAAEVVASIFYPSYVGSLYYQNSETIVKAYNSGTEAYHHP